MVKYTIKWEVIKYTIKWKVLKYTIKWEVIKYTIKWEVVKYTIKWELVKYTIKWEVVKYTMIFYDVDNYIIADTIGISIHVSMKIPAEQAHTYVGDPAHCPWAEQDTIPGQVVIVWVLYPQSPLVPV